MTETWPELKRNRAFYWVSYTLENRHFMSLFWNRIASNEQILPEKAAWEGTSLWEREGSPETGSRGNFP